MEKLYVYGVALVVLWLFRKERERVASVDFEAPTVSGSGSDEYGGQDYATTPAIVPDLRMLVNQTAARLEAFDAANPDAPESGEYGTLP